MSRYLLVTQVYPPDTAAVGQHMADIAEALVTRGHSVDVLTSNRGYDDPSIEYSSLELRRGVRVLRRPLTSFGKSSIGRRLVGGLSLVLQATIKVATSTPYDVLLLTTSPPMGALVGIAGAYLGGVPFYYWLMDLNPDQALELGHARAGSIQVEVFDCLNRAILRNATRVITLDEAMASRFHRKLPGANPPSVLPVWAPGDFPPPVEDAGAVERATYGLGNRRILMYAGNHSIAHPLDDIFAAAKRRDGSGKLGFVFMGGGLAKVPIDNWVKSSAPAHVRSLPYQPLEAVHRHLAMSDVQVVSVGPKTVGIVHPSKIYGAMAAARPILVIGPKESPAARLVTEYDLGWVVEHGDTAALERVLIEIEDANVEELRTRGKRCWELANTKFSRENLISEFLGLIRA